MGYSRLVLFNQLLKLSIGQEDYDKLRPLSYPDTDVFLCCFSVVDPTSLENVKQRWIPELRHHSKAPIVLVGTKTDVREDHEYLRKQKQVNPSFEPITFEQAVKVQRQQNCVAYVECSAKNHKGLKNVFLKCIEVVLKPAPKEESKKPNNCTLV